MESLLLFALFLLLPLVEQLVKYLRRRAEAAPARPAPPPVPVGAGLPSPGKRDARPHRVRPAPRPNEPAAAPRQLAPTLPVQPTGWRRRGAKNALRSTTGPRRAVVLATILGPCRALEPETFQQPSR